MAKYGNREDQRISDSSYGHPWCSFELLVYIYNYPPLKAAVQKKRKLKIVKLGSHQRRSSTVTVPKPEYLSYAPLWLLEPYFITIYTNWLTKYLTSHFQLTSHVVRILWNVSVSQILFQHKLSVLYVWVLRYNENKQRVPLYIGMSRLIIGIFKWNIQKSDWKPENKNWLSFDQRALKYHVNF